MADPKKIFLTILLFNLAACQGFMEAVKQGGNDGLVWPLPPTPARLLYDGEIDINQAMSASVGLVTGMHRQFSYVRPYRVATSRDLIGIVDDDRGTAYLIDRFRNSVSSFYSGKGEESREIRGVKDITIDDMKRVYLLDSLKGRVVVFKDNGGYIREFGSSMMWTKPDRMAIDTFRHRIYVADSFQGRVYVFSTSGVFLYVFGEQGSARGRFAGLSDMDIDMEGNLYILEATNQRIQVFDPQGVLIKILTLDQQYFREPVAIGVEKSGTIYIADRYLSRVAVLDKTGQMILDIGGLGRRRGKFADLSDLDFDQSRQRLFTAETGSSRLQIFRRTAEQWLPFP